MEIPSDSGPGGFLSPILVRPVREQLEHDRIIRLLQARLKRRHEVAINLGDEQAAVLKVGTGQMFPDLMLTGLDRAKRLEGIVEVETSESVNHLEAMAQWAHFGRAKAPFHLYVPAACVEIARRLCTDNQVNVSELWSYHTLGDQTRFTLVQRSATASAEERPKKPAAASAVRTARKASALSRRPGPAARSAKNRTAKSKSAAPSRTATRQKRK